MTAKKIRELTPFFAILMTLSTLLHTVFLSPLSLEAWPELREFEDLFSCLVSSLPASKGQIARSYNGFGLSDNFPGNGEKGGNLSTIIS